ncbi:30S ribosomal protein S31 [Chryseobacterium ginsenosidimutans]|nr:30S ribosomal protein THX [Chryseobacterium ginsenosidimutans]MDQ0592686.1 30S ribosomal protein S31 [Chryseobacterium ginsenosidimutans]
MGKGDKKSRRGKINSGSYGKRRPRKTSKSLTPSEEKSKQ